MNEPAFLKPPVVPSLKDAQEFAWSTSLGHSSGIYGFNSMDARSRSFNLIRSKLAKLRQMRDWRLIGFVSATPSVGKSFVSGNVAASLSRDPRWQTYLVDLDLRRGGTAELFGLELESGLESYLATGSTQTSIPAYRPEGQRLVLVPNVPTRVASAEILATQRARQLLKAMREASSTAFFLFDLPPVFANDDAAMTLELLDGYVLVAEEGKTTRRDVDSAVGMLGGDRLAGVVLNKYQGGIISEGRGIEERYAAGYYGLES